MGTQMNRRDFLKTAAAGAAVLVVGVDVRGALAAGSEATDLNPFVRIERDGTVTVIIKHFEMGQGTTTGLTTLVAEELDADWSRVATEFAPANQEKYKNLFWGVQGTGGSSAMANSFMQYRGAGAAARDLLVRAAAAQWGVDAAEIRVNNGVIQAGSRQGHFGEFVARAATMTPVQEPALKQPGEFRLIGKLDLPRKDNQGKTDGTAVFAMDVSVDGMVYAAVFRSPRFGGKLREFDPAEAGKVAGFIDARAMPDGSGVAVFAKNTWAAFRARDALECEWDFSNAESRGQDALIEAHRQMAEQPEYQARPLSPAASGEAIAAAAQVVEAEFVLPYLAHAPMEPLNCVIERTANGVRVHDGCQMPTGAQAAVSQVLGLEPAQVEINTVYAGGSFGRRATPTSDYHVEAAQAFALLGGKTPVKLVWSREDDIRGGYYRAMALHRTRVGIGADGSIAGWDHRVVTRSIMKGTAFEGFAVHDGIDHTSVEGCADTLYQLPNMSVGLSDFQSAIPPLWWRSVGHTHTAFAMESLLDMAAHASARDPVELRLSLLDRSNDQQRRMAGVIEAARDRAGWKPGDRRGFAAHFSFKSWVAVVAEVTVSGSNVHVDKLVMAVDCGVAVNPDVIRAQMEGGAGYALGAILRNEITFENGEVQQTNFPNYEPLRISDMPQVEVEIVASAEAPSGIGEPGVPPTGPAVANAIFAATGDRITELPLSKSGYRFV